ncbi:polyhydroxybutyrate depolymerase [Fodinibius salinus]|uniref:Polyhydroxybutyrate depolymerase n=1 Tax=Fodinibius salinus TaxID=860790 RepID=A0A5D3YPC3_9BACT|nr:PHB depolymerase family esterase [Fodinibius salinus]TYP94019.1 polyhydroxybutyrate depolymerase [Fodinibius salinus]
MCYKNRKSRRLDLQPSSYFIYRFLLFPLLFLFLISCGNEDSAKPMTKDTERLSQSIKVDGNVREYILHIPHNQEELSTLPIVFVLHGGRGSPEAMEQITNFHTQKSSTEFITVYPASTGKFWNDGRANADSTINDIKFIESLVDTLKTQYSIDKNGVFATGLSNGGTMSVRLGCESSNIKAISAVASTAVKNVIDNCSLDTPKPFMLIQGTSDPITNFNGVQKEKRKIVSHNYAIDKFLSLNNCSSKFTDKAIPDTSNDKTSTVIKRYEDCQTKSKVISVVVKNGGHTWPGSVKYRSRFLVGNISQDFNASEIIWDFFYSQI